MGVAVNALFRRLAVPPVAVFATMATCAVCLAALFAAGEGGMPGVAQPDALVYHRYALSMREGAFYAFNPGDAATTGCTSHVWLWLSAVAALPFGSFRAVVLAQTLFGAVLFAATVGLGWTLARRVAPQGAVLGAALIALSGQTAFTAFSQVDMALYVPAALGFACAAAFASRRWMPILAAALPWVRPEGALLPVLLAIVFLAPGAGKSALRKPAALSAIVAVASLLLVFAFNRLVTGRWQFDSIAGAKATDGLPLPGTVETMVSGLLSTWETGLLGISTGGLFLLLPPVVGVLGAMAFVVRRDHDVERRRLAWWLGLAALATMALGAAGGYSSQASYRLIAWTIPVLLVFFAGCVGGICAAYPNVPRLFVAAPLILWQIATVAYYGLRLHEGSVQVESRIAFVREATEALPPGARVGMKGATGFVVAANGLAATNIVSYTSADFDLDGCTSCALEVLKREPGTRFDAWLLYEPDSAMLIAARTSGDTIAVQRPDFGPANAFTLFHTDWTMLDAGLEPVGASALRALRDRTLAERLDVGYPPDERRLNYRIDQAEPDVRIQPFGMSGHVEGIEMLETGRTVTGTERFEVPVDPKKPLVVVVRAAVTAPVQVYEGRGGWSGSIDMPFESAVVSISIDGNPAGAISLSRNGTDHFTEKAFTIPVQMLTSTPARFEVSGNHHSLAWWFYQ